MIQFIAARQERTFVDADGVTIHFYQWKVGKPRGIVQIAHGLGEYAGRYEELAQKLVTAGFTVYADDHRGHGQTGLDQWGGDRSKLGDLGPGGIRSTIAEVRQLSQIIREENPGVPLALLGHSWGSLIAQSIVNKHAEDYDALVLTGTAYRTLIHMNGGDLAKKHAHLGSTGYEWLSRDDSVGQAFLDDPLTFKANGMKLFGLADSLRLLGRPARNLARDIPVLIQIGSEDTLGGERSVEKLARAYLSRAQLSDVELIVYADARHEIFNEINREEVYADTIAWLLSRLAPAS
ncbi:alpha/beta hydrolase [Lacisediminihabitans profunda]|uniref:alpha/beta hydrolase n=1 Tax=Lacisediminihabitans profunda TaxID=2594790 RepID=UPI00164EED0D|nr:alpha/beta hydrolase [Lacisediminihabitans profunda]